MYSPIRVVGPLFFAPLLLGQKPAQKITYLTAHPIVQHSNDKASSSLIMEEMPLVAPLFIEDHSTTSVLALVNNGVNSAGASISVHNLQGSETARQHVVLKPHESRNLPIASIVSSGSSQHYGSISVVQDSDLKGPAIAAQLLIMDNSNTTPAYLDEELAMPDMEGSSVLRSVTDEAVGPPLLAVTNLSATAQKITVRCFSASNNPVQTSSTIGPMATSLTSACTGAFVSDLTQFLYAKPAAKSIGAVGIEIVGDGGAGQLAAFAIAPHLRNADTVFSAVPFTDPALIHSPDIVFAGVPIGPQPTLPDGLYIPRVSLSNFASASAKVTVSLNVTARSRVASSDNTSSIRDPQEISTIIIPAHSTQEVLFTGNESQSGLLNSIYVSSDRQPGDVQGKLVSRSLGSLYEIELLGKDAKDLNNGGVHPWTADGDAESHLVLYNHSKSKQKFDVAISNGLTVWDKSYVLDPSETLELSFNQLLRDKVPDDKHQVLEPAQTVGVVNWSTTDGGNATGRLMVTSRTSMMARNFSCGNYTVICGGYLADYNEFIGVGQSSQLFALIPSFCASWSPGQCGGNQQSGGGAGYYSNVNDSSIVTFNDSSQQYAQSPMLLGMGSGSTNVIMNATENGCRAGGTGGATVQVPTQSRIIMDDYSHATVGCPSGQAGWDRQVYKIFTDQQVPAQDIAIDGIAIEEGVGPFSRNDLQLGQPGTRTASTNNVGQFLDRLAACSSVCPANQGESDAAQNISATLGQVRSNTGANAFVYKCTSNSINGN